MKYFLDSEFIEYPNTIELISIGLISEDDREYYALNKESDLSKASEWVIDNVLNKIPEYDSDKNIITSGKTLLQIRQDLLNFCGQENDETEECEFFTYYGSYDWVLFCWIFGKMIDLPKGFPMYTTDLKQMMDSFGLDKGWKDKNCPEQEDEHLAISDAKWNKSLYYKMISHKEDKSILKFRNF